MTGLVKKWKPDTVKENEGVAVEYDVNDDGTIPTFTIRRIGCIEHTKVQNRMYEQFRTQQRLKMIPAEKNVEILRDAFATGCIAKWENIQDEQGVEIPFTPENACKLLKDMPDLYYDLSSKAGEKDNYKADALEVAAKN